MKQIAIYVEGGGGTVRFQNEIRNGLDALLGKQKQAARHKRLGWKVVPCGGRDQAYNAFINRIRQPNSQVLVILLVDSEDEVPAELAKPENETLDDENQRKLADAKTRKDHLTRREPWDLKDVPPERIHMMVRCMEAWIVADPEALDRYYRDGFNEKKLPASPNLENEPKPEIYKKLEEATKNTSKKAYAKIKHASKLLALIDPTKVAKRCPRFATFVGWLDDQIKKA